MSGFNPMPLSDVARAWLQSVVGGIGAVEPLADATTATVIGVRTDRAEYVLKWFTWDRFLAEEPDRLEHEIFGLQLAEHGRIPAPRVVAVDPNGDHTGYPGLLMTRLSGGSLPRPNDWPTKAARVAHSLHQLQAECPHQHRPHVPPHLQVIPEWAVDAGAWRAAFDRVAELRVVDPVIIHRDLHRWNMLWDGDDLTGVVDWLSVCRGPVGEDVGRVWINEVLSENQAGAAAFRAAYLDLAGAPWDPGWELQAVIDMLPAYESAEAVHRWGGPAERRALEACLIEAVRRT